MFDLERDPGETTNLLSGAVVEDELVAAQKQLRERLIDYERRWGPAGTPFAQEARLATQDVPMSSLDRLDLSAWRSAGMMQSRNDQSTG